MDWRLEIRDRVCLFGTLTALIALAQPGFAAAPAKAPAKAPPPPAARGQQFYAPVFAKAQYESQLSLNDHCPVKHGKLNPGIRPTYINRQPVGFC